jgi:uncharacterized membrane protein
VLGAGTFGIEGFLFGAGAGFLFGAQLMLGRRVRSLETELQALRRAAAPAAIPGPVQPHLVPLNPAHRAASEFAEQQASAGEAQPGREAETAPQSIVPQPQPEAARTLAASAQAAMPVARDIAAAFAPAAPSAAQDEVETRAGPQASVGGSTAPPRRGLADYAIVRYVKEYFSTGNLLVKVGVIILFFGVAFLLKYATEHTNVPIEFRLVAVAIGAVALLAVGWRLRLRRPAYGLVLQGGAIGVLYLLVFAALRLYQLLPPLAAFALLLAIVVFSAILAVRQNAISLAVMGIAGGFLAPILASTGGGSHVMLFSYYALLNAGILAIAWFKAWRLLNLLGFAFTFVIGIAWGVTSYRSEFFASTEPFLILFFVFYVAIAILYATRQATDLKGYVDGTLVFGTPLLAFGLQTALMRNHEYGLAYSALALGAFYLLVASILYRRRQESMRLLVEAFLALGILFATLTIPLAFDGNWTAATWALEGAAILWVGVRQKRLLARLFGMLLQFGAGAALLTGASIRSGPYPVLNSVYLGCFMIALAALFSAWYVRRHRAGLYVYEAPASALLFAWGMLWWLGGGLHEIDRYAAARYFFNGATLFLSLTSVVCSWLERRLVWPAMRIPPLALIGAMALLVAGQILDHRHAFAQAGYVVWPLAFAVYYWALRRHEDSIPPTLVKALHVSALWLLAVVATWEAEWNIERWVHGAQTWPLIAWLIVPALLLLLISRRGERLEWPTALHWETYIGLGAVPLALFATLWSLFANFASDGSAAPLPYLPLLNPLDIAQVFVFLVLAAWVLKLRAANLRPFAAAPERVVYGAFAALAFIWLNAVLLRTLHHWAGVAFAPHAMLSSTLVQAALAIFWSVLALTVMFFATRKGLRILWMMGAALMGVVVIKLFTVDISNVGGLARIVSFIGVALLLLVIGYVSPIPPSRLARKT